MSWFNQFNVESLQDLSKKVQNAMPDMSKMPAMPDIPVPAMDVVNKMVDKDMLEKLTLSTPELSAERQKIDDEERRKEKVRDMLAGMMPWETRDKERDILVEECKEAILQLSSRKETFLGPYAVPESSVKIKSKSKKKGGEGDDAEENEDDYEKQQHDEQQENQPSKESLERLAKLEPLPPLLHDFDFHAHVGLIQRLLEVDPKLVEMQSSLSGGGKRELTFWRNYFFHCAYTRYEAGLSIDEIWSEQPPPTDATSTTAKDASAAAPAVAGTTAKSTSNSETDEEMITFDAKQEKAFSDVVDDKKKAGTTSVAGIGSDAKQPTSTVTAAATITATATTDKKEMMTTAAAAGAAGTGASTTTNNGTSEGADFEMVGGTEADASTDDADYELDELEAEIARELED